MAYCALIAYFDGRFKEGIGAAGFLVWGQDGSCIDGCGIYY